MLAFIAAAHAQSPMVKVTVPKANGVRPGAIGSKSCSRRIPRSAAPASKPTFQRRCQNGNRQAWTIQNAGGWSVGSDRRQALVVSIGDRAGFPPAGLAPSLVKLAPAAAGATGFVIGSTKGGKDWKSSDVALEMTEGASGVWNVKPTKDLKPGDYAIIMRPSNSNALMPEIAWAFTVK